MDLYTKTSYQVAELITKNYSTSFSASSRLFPKSMRRHIYAIYGLVRVADEIVDTYSGEDQMSQLNTLESEVALARSRGYSANPLVHAFALTAEQYFIEKEIVAPFFESMRMDIGDRYTKDRYEHYIYGSAEVVGLMCLRVFVGGDRGSYQKLKPGAKSLGSAYQKVNFLRDIKADYELGRMYFPGVDYDTFGDEAKLSIEADISADFRQAHEYIKQLPVDARMAVWLSYRYYEGLLSEIKKHPASELKQQRIRVPGSKKFRMLLLARIKQLGGKV